MASRYRILLSAAVLLNGLVLAGCETGGISDKLGEIGDSITDMIPGGGKKKLPGDRKPVFPEGVPGVAQGVPPELVKGNQPPPDVAETQVPEPVKQEPPKPKPKKKVVAQKPPPQAPVQQQSQPAAWPAPAQQPTTQWPAPPAQQPEAQTAWPEPPPLPPGAQTR
jgi:hypothetical protein